MKMNKDRMNKTIFTFSLFVFFIAFFFFVSSCKQVGLFQDYSVDLIDLYGSSEAKVSIELPIIRIRFSPKDRSLSKFVLRIKVKGNKFRVWLPGVFHNNNTFSSGPYSLKKSRKWIVREDRLPIPGVLLWSDGKFFILLKITEPTYDEGECETDISGLGFSLDDKEIIFTFPYEEYPISYIRKLGVGNFVLSDAKSCYFSLKEEKEIKLAFFEGEGDFSSAIKTMWQKYFDYKKEKIKSVIPKTVRDIEEISDKIRKVKVAISKYFEKYFVDDKIAGFFSFVQTSNGEKILNFLEGGFTGMVLLNARNTIEIGKEFTAMKEKMKEMGKKVIASWLENKVNGFIPDCFLPSGEICHLPPIFFRDSFFTRRQFESLYSIYQFAKSLSGDDSSIYFAEFLSGAYNMLKLQAEDGSFGRRYSFDGKVLEEEKSGTYFAIPVFLKAYELTRDDKFLKSALRSGEFIINMVKSEYPGSTLDANSEDKEADIWILYSLYLLWKATGEKKFLHYAEKALYSSLIWFYLWNVPFPKNSLFGKIKLQTMGLGSVSVENIHIDVYSFFFPQILQSIGLEIGDERVIDMSQLITLSILNVVPVEGDEKGSVVGIVPEVLHQTIWDYGFFGKGYYNILSATGWTVASILSTLYPLY